MHVLYGTVAQVLSLRADAYAQQWGVYRLDDEYVGMDVI